MLSLALLFAAVVPAASPSPVVVPQPVATANSSAVEWRLLQITGSNCSVINTTAPHFHVVSRRSIDISVRKPVRIFADALRHALCWSHLMRP